MIAASHSQDIAFAAGALTFTLVCLWMLIVAIWPRRQGDASACRRCRAVLDKPPAPTCPGCGADLTRKKSTIRGVRNRRPWLIVFSGILVVLGATIVAGAAVNILDRRSLYRIAPQWLLVTWVQSPEHDINIDMELSQRLLRGTLDREGIELYVDQLITRQSRWITAWVELSELYDRGWLTDGQLQRIHEIAVSVDFETRKRATAGGLIPLRLRLGWIGPQRLMPEIELAPLRIVGAGVEREEFTATTLSRDDFGTIHETCTVGQPGEYTLIWPMTIRLQRYASDVGWHTVYSREQSLEQRISVVREEIPRRVRDPARNPADAIGVELIGPRIDSGYEARVQVKVSTVSGNGLPVAVIGRVKLAAPGRETADLGLIVLRPGGDNEKELTSLLPGPLPSSFQVTIIPDTEVAPFVLDVDDYWAESIAFESVEVQRERAFVDWR